MTATTAQPALPPVGAATRALLRQETRLLLREPAVLIFAAVLLLAAVLVMSAIPGARVPLPPFGGLSVVQAYTSTLVLFSTSIIGLTALPGILAGYREVGVLRRLRTTPVSPANLLLALFLVLAVAGALVAIVITLVPAVFGAGFPARPVLFAGGAFGSLVAFLGLGAVLAAVVTNPKAASGLGNLVAAIMWFSAGMWLPRAQFPHWVATLADLTPGGAAAAVMEAATHGVAVGWQPFVVLLAWTAGGVIVARAVFRWE